MPKINEDTIVEQPVIEWLKEMGYDYEFGPDLAPGGALMEREDFREVLLIPRLERSLKRLNSGLPDSAINEVIDKLKKVEHPSPDILNRDVYKMLVEGVKMNIRKDGEKRGEIVKVFDFKNPLNNEFLIVNQFAIQGVNCIRRPDVVVFVNGIPVSIFELKSPTSPSGTVRSAYEQLEKYKKDIPDIFKYNQILAISDLMEARHGTISSSWEWFSNWKGIESEDEKHEAGESQLEILAKGVFNKERLMDIIENFIVFEADSAKDTTKYTKKMCLYHQYFGVNKAIKETLRATGEKGNKRVGVFWHTQGSGKTLSMVFYVNKTKKLEELKSPSFVFLTDRNDLDGQFYKTFLRNGYPMAKQADSIKGLKRHLRDTGGELIFATIQKFDIRGENLSNSDNIVVIADEAHRSQYAKFAGNVRDALPNASFMGITGTPISLRNRDTQLVFGKHISEYQINRAVEDKATVPIYYEGRLVPLHLSNHFLDEEFEDLTSGKPFDIKENMKRKWARLEQAVGSKERLEQVAKDIIEHFNNRGLEGKGMIVAISRRVAVELYKIISKMPDAPEVAVVISKTEDFEELKQYRDTKEIEKRFKNPDDKLKMVIVCDMWLTGFDVPALHTMYIDKPLKNHTLMQAIARVNRKYLDKAGGLIVDYIGIADNLKKALSLYSSDIQKEAMIPIEEVIAKMMEKYDIIKTMFNGIDYAGWKKMQSTEWTRLLQKSVDQIISSGDGKIDKEKKKRFLKESELLFKLFALAMPHHEANRIRDEVEFFQAVKKTITKSMAIPGVGEVGVDVESAVKELISESIKAEGVIDIFDMKGKGEQDISIFDEKFLKEVKNMKFKNISIEVLRKLLNDELRIRMRKNMVRYKSLIELLESIIEEYENNIINSTKVIERLIKLAKDIKDVEKEGIKLGLDEEEKAFFDVVSQGKGAIGKNGEVKEMVKELVKMIKRDLAVDWTNRENIEARIRANIRLLLLRKNYTPQESEKMIVPIMQQAKYLYKDYLG